MQHQSHSVISVKPVTIVSKKSSKEDLNINYPVQLRLPSIQRKSFDDPIASYQNQSAIKSHVPFSTDNQLLVHSENLRKQIRSMEFNLAKIK